MGKAYIKTAGKGTSKLALQSVSAKKAASKVYLNSLPSPKKPTVAIQKSVDVNNCSSKAYIKGEPQPETVYVPSVPVSVLELIQLAIDKDLLVIPTDCDEVRECINIKDAVGDGSPEDPFIIPTSSGKNSYYVNVNTRIPDSLPTPGFSTTKIGDSYWQQYTNGHALWLWDGNAWLLNFRHKYPETRYRQIFTLDGATSCFLVTENSGVIPANPANYRITDNGQVLYPDNGFVRFTIDAVQSTICLTDENGTPITPGDPGYPSALEVLFWFV